MTADEKRAALPQDLRTVAAMIAAGERIAFGREVELMRLAAVEIEELRGHISERNRQDYDDLQNFHK